MALVFALGIPASFLWIVFAHRRRLNPEPLVLIAKTIFERTTGGEPPTAETKTLAFAAATLLNASRELRTQAMALHAAALTDQLAKSQEYDSEVQAVEEARRAGRRSRRLSSVRKVLLQKLRALHREIQVASEWTEFLPSHAEAVRALEESLAIAQMKLVLHYRSSDPDIRNLGFLVDACKSCVRCILHALLLTRFSPLSTSPQTSHAFITGRAWSACAALP